MVQTTFRLLGADQSDTDPTLIALVEGVTGAWGVYGLDTPINVLNILDKAGLETAITCFYASLTDNRDLAKNIGIALAQGHLYAYLNALPNDTRLFDLLYYCSLYLQTVGVGVTPRTNYCGDPVGSSGPVSLAQIIDVASRIQTTINGLNLVGIIPIYTMMISSNGPFSDASFATAIGNQIISILRGSPINDPANQIPTGLAGYTPTPLSQLSSNPDAFLTNNINYDPFSPVFYVAKIQYQNPNIVPVNYTNRAALGIGTAAIMASQQVSQNNGMMLNLICNQIKSAITDYDATNRQTLDPQLTYYQQLARGVPAGTTGIAQWDIDGKAVMDAGLNRRAQLLRNQTYMSQFDTSGTGTLNAADRITAEKAIQKEMLSTRIATATPLYNAVFTSYLAFTVQTDQVSSILRTYLL